MASIPRMFFMTALLEALRRLAAGGRLVSHSALYSEVVGMSRDGPDPTWRDFRYYGRDFLFEQLKELEVAGLVSAHRLYEGLDGRETFWKLNSKWFHQDSYLDRDTRKEGNHDEPPSGDGPPPDGGDGDGGGGFGDVLAHPHLFVVSRDDLRDSISRALGATE